MTNDQARGSQRLTVEQLQAWEALRFGMFIHYGMSTYTGSELPDGSHPSSLYAPDRLDVDQWVSVARDTGMKYAVLTAKHVSGHCLWPSRQTDYHVGTSGNRTDVVEAFVNACARRGVLPGIYYCSFDNHHKFGSLTPSDVESWERELICRVPDAQLSFTTRAYQEFQTAQITEPLTQYGPVAEVWIDIPAVLPRCYRQELYGRIAELQPQAVIMMNTGIGDGSIYPVAKAWPADIMAIERFLPNSHTGHVKWREIEGRPYYLPGEVCDPIGREWFFTEGDQARSDGDLLGMYLTSVHRGCNFLLDVGPDRHGLIPDKYLGALRRLRANLDKLGM